MIDRLIAYFTYLATQHPDLLHADVSGQRAVEVMSVEEAFGDIRTGARPQSPLLRLIFPTWSLSPLNADARKRYQWGIMVMAWHSGDPTSDELVAAVSDSETIADDIIARLVSDARNNHPLLGFSVRSADQLNLNGEVVERVADGTYSGVLYTFNLTTDLLLRSTPSTTCAPVVWADGGLTPNNIPA